MTKSIILILTISLFSALVSPSLFAAELKNTNLSKSELCDFAIQALGELLKQQSGAASKATITKEQCMAISDDDINKAAKKIMESGKVK